MKRVASVAAFLFVLSLAAIVAASTVLRARFIHLGGWIPITRTVEFDKSGGSGRVQPGADKGANLYPRKAQPSDKNAVYPLFPKDALYSFLGLDVQNLVGPVVNDEARADWVLDTLPNTDAPRYIGGIAYGILTNPNAADTDPDNDLQTGTTDPTTGTTRGHWPGLRVVDGIGNADMNVFKAGGKENDTSSWQVAAGSVGSAKFDITQAYVAESTYVTPDLANYPSGIKSVLMFGAERRDNSGTSAFDLEINRNPASNQNIPNRTVGDVLVSVELPSGVGNGKFFLFTWDGTRYQPFNIAALPIAKQPQVSLNRVPTPSAPWGFVDSKGVWTIGQIPASCFAEVIIPISPELPLLSGASNDTTQPLYMQIRSRASVGDTSDLKDLTTYFLFAFGGPTPSLAMRSTCAQGLSYFPQWSDTGPADTVYKWQFGTTTGTLLSNDAGFGQDADAPDDPSRYAALFGDANLRTLTATLPPNKPYTDLDVYLTINPGKTSESMLFDTIRVYRQLAATPTLSKATNKSFTYSPGVVGGKAPYTYSWQFYNSDNVLVGASTTASGVFEVPKADTYHAVLTVNDTGDLDKDVCSVTSNSNNLSLPK